MTAAPRQYFGTDGIRTTVGQPPMTPDFVLHLANAVGRVLKRQHASPTVLIGKDTRISGYMIESALESGLIAAGVNVTLLGPLPTPAVAYLTAAQRAQLGIVISASHNPFADNGIKFFNGQGRKLPDTWELEIEAELAQSLLCVPSQQLGRAQRLSDAPGRYVEFCKSTFDRHLSLSGLKIVVDAAHGAAYQVGPMLLHELGADVTVIGTQPDGLNINEQCGATHPDALVQAVRAQHADYGIALDGDADRLQMIDSTGRLFNGDELVYLLGMDRHACGQKLPGLVGTLMTNRGIEVALEQQGMELVRARVGDRYVMEELDRRGWLIGGESSGHILVRDKHSTGDGLIAALQVLQAVVRTGRSMAEQLRTVQLYPQHMINVRMAPGTAWQQHAALQQAIADTEATLGANGRVLIRASGTEPVLRVMVEATTLQAAQQHAQHIAAQVPAST